MRRSRNTVWSEIKNNKDQNIQKEKENRDKGISTSL